MEMQALAKFVILSPRKAWRITRELRGLEYKAAMEYLREMTPKAARVLEKVLRSAFYNSLQLDGNLTEEDLFIKEVIVNQGPVYKRLSPRAQGRADITKKRTSHIRVVLAKKEAK